METIVINAEFLKKLKSIGLEEIENLINKSDYKAHLGFTFDMTDAKLFFAEGLHYVIDQIIFNQITENKENVF